MSIEIRVPTLGESVTEATVAKWLKKAGEPVSADEPVVELETDKVSLEVPAPSAGVLSEILVDVGSDVSVGTVIGRIETGGAAAAALPQKPAAADVKEQALAEGDGPASPMSAPARAMEKAETQAAQPGGGAAQAGPAARKLAEEKGIDLAAVTPTGPKGNVTKADVLTHPAAAKAAPAASAPAPAPAARPTGREERVRMTRLRKRIAERLKEAQNTAAMLTTFNEVDMTAVSELRSRYQDAFQKKHGIKLGFMSFFVKAAIEALKAYPAVNAEIDGDDIVYKHYYDIGVAVSTDQGLVVPVVRDADVLGLADIEKRIADLGKRARDGKLAMEELTGGTFTITNGGVFGSMLSTPILNPPQVGILGMHATKLRPVVMPDGSIQARPMMYLALSYDHRIIDGREAVSFLVRVKECIEAPERMLIDA
ncbi:2-oxoglutarate dehydrogenase complex dihydrolipoyllysine-residue succinyltransferase [Benzoatithermus flavus]|uniref:Dihydrolipoyllysine-residue succinyltransferase component of 2-oxoglutarate dehydrogenase complex n=1 Tax=Benzoatithermus flavus TaxID=3108223 RepID=A0ABU8XXT0_9PROT